MDLTPHQRYLIDKTIPEALEFAALQWPDNPALTHIEGGGPTLTWAELREQTGRVRTGLEHLGVAPGDKVGIMLRNQVEFPLAWLAVVEAGAVAVPMNPKYTPREIDFVLGDAGARWLVATDDIVTGTLADDRIGPVPSGRIVAVGDPVANVHHFAELTTRTPTPRTHRARRDDVVNIQFTSGTTGLPKGCLLTHAYWIELGVHGAAVGAGPQRILADHPFYYMQNQAYLVMALTVGGGLYVTAGLSRRKFMGWLVEHRIDMAWIDEGLLDLPESEADRKLALKKAPVSALPPSLHESLERRFGLRAREFYASTEVGNGTYVPYERTDTVGTGSMGWCFPNRESKVIDADGNEVEPGRSGELCLRGSAMMLGYHNRPDTNAELFLPGGWFRTGDIVRKDTDGQHYYEGRIRDVIRRSGENIAAAEVELQIMALPEVDEVGVIPVPDRQRDEEVKAVVVLKPGARLTAQEIEAWCLEGLARFKVPRYIEFRDRLPHTSSGKIAKAELRAEPHSDRVIDLRAS
ncbi:class I adenylate-forming enzyme family protein [Streptomyces griseiscabiei]|uniref:Class I adenylate-forming enzyme family protein n=1 Tax=Streptomyces griseiscabiei TaxID=2993540 RepID=A0ABU4L2T5_9ACTN|nr:class I adenylate-forming enzyme family protein [Streptomyces griseiscabiei]MBZ3901491.1 acyl--CoA ligase [Streptomyces griseiscabiei]MDX2909959.1 class I adenylate-forming enzyme family protein [Streptomyces griseiscabiei]